MGSMVFLTLVIVAVSGLIAYVGDLIGRKMGRKRLTLFGLRPKHTAIIISVGMGMVIAALTLTATFVVSKRIREAFFTPLDLLKAQKAAAEQQVEISKEQVQYATRQAYDAMQELKTNSAQLDKSRKQRDKVEGQLKQEKSLLDTIKKQLQQDKLQLQLVNQKLAKAKQDYNAAQRILVASSQRLIKLNEEVLNLQGEATDLQTKIASLQGLLGPLVQTNFAPIAFESGQEILSGVFSTGGNDVARQQALTKFFTQAEAIIRKRSPQMKAEDAALLFFRPAQKDKDHFDQIKTLDEVTNLLSKRIDKVTKADQVVIRLAPANNVPVNGPAVILVDQLELIPNEVVFTKGYEVAKVDIPAGAQANTAEVFSILADKLLSERIPATLRAKQMLMIARRFDADHPNVVPQPSPSMLSWADLLATAEQVRAQKAPATVVARTRTQLRQYDPVDLTLVVEPTKP